jgi:ATP-dependent helicase/nuclease subunit A
MDWLGIWFKIQGSSFSVEPGAHGELPLLRWRALDDAELIEAPKAIKTEMPATASWDEKEVKAWNEILNWKYPFEDATKRAAKTSVTALRREAAEELDDESENPFSATHFAKHYSMAPAATDRQPKATRALNAVDTGVAHHKFLQYFSFESALDLKSFSAEAKRLEKEKYLSAEEAAALDLKALADFWSSKIGNDIRANAACVRRELAFTAGFSPAELDEIFGRSPGAKLKDEVIVIQGVADLVVLLPKEIWLVDFKTDNVTAKDLPEKIQFYSPQLKLYARALEKIYSRSVTHCWLHFLSARKTISIS